MASTPGKICSSSSSGRWGSDSTADARSNMRSNMVGGMWRGREGARERAAKAAAEIRARELRGTAEVGECLRRHSLAVDNRTLNLLLGVMVGGRAVSDTGDSVTEKRNDGRAADRRLPAVSGAGGTGFKRRLEERDWEGAKVVAVAFEAEGVELNERIYTTLISCFGKGGRIEDCWRWLRAMERQWGVAPVQMGAHMQQVAEVQGVAQVNGAVGGEREEGEVQGKSEEGSREQRGWGEKGEGEGENGGGEGGAYGKNVLLPEDIYDVILGACVQCEDWKGALAIYHHLSAHGAAAASASASASAAAAAITAAVSAGVASAAAVSEAAALSHTHHHHRHHHQPVHGEQRMPRSSQFALVLRACARAGRWQLARDLLLAADDVFVAALATAAGASAASARSGSGCPAAAAAAADGAVSGSGLSAAAAAAADGSDGSGGGGSCSGGNGGGVCAPPLSPHHPPIATSSAMFTDVITACARSAQPVPALLLLDRLDSHPSPDLYADVAAYTAAISACASVGQWENAIRLLTRMQQQPIGKEMGRNGKASSMPKLEFRGKQDVLRKPAVQPNVVTWTAVMSACAMAGRADVAREVLRRMMREGNGEEGEEKREGEWKWENEGTTERKGKTDGERKGEGDGNEEERVVNGRRKVTRRVERLVVTGATSASCLDAISDATSDCRANVVTWTVVLTACARAGEWQQAEALFTQMQTNGVMPNEVSWAALISAYAKGGQWEKAIGALRAIRGGQGGQKEKWGKEEEKEAAAAAAAVPAAATALEPSNPPQSSPLPSAWNAALHACAKAGKWKLLGSLVQEMQEAGRSPSVVTYGVLVGGYGRAGQARLAREAFDEMLSAEIR
ncbi:unnamed protein product [Closterium sp. NIES-54]